MAHLGLVVDSTPDDGSLFIFKKICSPENHELEKNVRKSLLGIADEISLWGQDCLEARVDHEAVAVFE